MASMTGRLISFMENPASSSSRTRQPGKLPRQCAQKNARRITHVSRAAAGLMVTFDPTASVLETRFSTIMVQAAKWFSLT
jgi:hypothetical protein